jgi:hypothetical protein
MSLRHATATRLVSAYLLITIALMMVPKADIPETLFDEANNVTNEMVVEKTVSSWQSLQSVTTFVPSTFVQMRKISVRRIVPIYAARLTDSCTFRELFCFFLC